MNADILISLNDEEVRQMAKSSTGVEENVAGLLCYVAGWVSGLVFFLIEKDSKFVKFHAMQSIITFVPLMIVWLVVRGIFYLIPFVGWVITSLVGVLFLVLWIVLMIKAYQGEKFKLPVIGDLAEKWSA